MAIARDNSKWTPAAAGSSFTISYAMGSVSNGIIWVWVGQDSVNSSNVTGVTYNGVALSIVKEEVNTTSRQVSTLWALAGPTSGTHNLVVSLSASTATAIGIVSYSGAKQTGIPDATGGNHNTSNAASLAVNITPVASNCWMISGCTVHSGANSLTVSGENQAILLGNGAGEYQAVSDSNGTVSAGAGTVTWGESMNDEFTAVAASFVPFVPATTNASFLLNMI